MPIVRNEGDTIEHTDFVDKHYLLDAFTWMFFDVLYYGYREFCRKKYAISRFGLDTLRFLRCISFFKAYFCSSTGGIKIKYISL